MRRSRTLINGLIIAGFRMMPFIVTLGMMGVARGTAKWLAGNQTVNAPKSSINQLMDLLDPLHFFPLPLGVWITLALAVIMAIVMQRTIFGRYIFAIGSNESTARLCGIRVGPMKVAIYTLSGLFFGLAGLMQMSRLAVGDPTVANGLELDIIAAVVIGGASLSGGTGSISGSIIGALIMAVLRSGVGSSLRGSAPVIPAMLLKSRCRCQRQEPRRDSSQPPSTYAAMACSAHSSIGS